MFTCVCIQRSEFNTGGPSSVASHILGEAGSPISPVLASPVGCEDPNSSYSRRTSRVPSSTTHLFLASSSSACSFPISICSRARSRAVSSSTRRASASSASYRALMPLTWGDRVGDSGDRAALPRDDSRGLFSTDHFTRGHREPSWDSAGSLTLRPDYGSFGAFYPSAPRGQRLGDTGPPDVHTPILRGHPPHLSSGVTPLTHPQGSPPTSLARALWGASPLTPL